MSDTGNTLMPPPRLSGDADADRRALERWMADLYSAFVLRGSVLGRISALETKVADLEARIVVLEGGP